MENAETAPNSTREGAVKKVVIAGGGTAGWIAAMTLSTHFGKLLDITLVESEEIGTVGVGESTVPPIVAFHKLLGIDEKHFMTRVRRDLQGRHLVRELGTHRRPIHPSVRPARPGHLDGRVLQLLAARAREGLEGPLGEYCYEWLAAMKGKFALRENPRINYAYHFDAALYARYLRKLSEPKGVKRVEGKIKQVRTHARPASSNRSSSRRARSSTATSSSTAPAFAGCSSKARCRRDTRTGRTGCRATARSHSRRWSMSRRSRIPPVTRTGRLALEHSRAASRRQWRGVLQPVHVG